MPTPLERLIQANTFGADLGSTAEGDISVGGGDFDLTEGEGKVLGAFVREITTPRGHLARYTFDRTGVSLQNEDYGNPMYFLLSENLTNEIIIEMKEGLRDVASNHPLLVVTAIDEALMPDGHMTRLVFNIRCRLVTGRELLLLVSPERDRIAVGTVA